MHKTPGPVSALSQPRDITEEPHPGTRARQAPTPNRVLCIRGAGAGQVFSLLVSVSCSPPEGEQPQRARVCGGPQCLPPAAVGSSNEMGGSAAHRSWTWAHASSLRKGRRGGEEMVNSGLRRGKLGPLKGPQKVGCYPCGVISEVLSSMGIVRRACSGRPSWLLKAVPFGNPSPSRTPWSPHSPPQSQLLPQLLSFPSLPLPPPSPTNIPSLAPPSEPKEETPGLQKARIKAELGMGPLRWS